MSTYSIKDVVQSNDRHKLYYLQCGPDSLSECIAYLRSENMTVVNMGKELAAYIDGLADYSYLSIDVYDFAKKLLDKNKSKIEGVGNGVLAIYNLGILMEPTLELNSAQLLKEFSKSASLIIIWENQSKIQDSLNWPTQNGNVFLDFTDTHIKKLQYAV